MQLGQPKIVVEVTQVFLQWCITITCWAVDEITGPVEAMFSISWLYVDCTTITILSWVVDEVDSANEDKYTTKSHLLQHMYHSS